MFKFRKNKTKPAPRKLTLWEFCWDWVKTIGIAVVMALAIKATVIEAYYVPTPSMEKTVMAGDFILGNKFIYGIKIPFTDYRLPAFSSVHRGDLVVFVPPHDRSENYVKRCIGIPGDTIEIIDKQIYVNGVLLEDDGYTQYISDQIIPAGQRIYDPYIEGYREYGVHNNGYRPFAAFRDNGGPIIVPEGKYFMMGDNRDNSLDSRMWGFADQKDIKGKALITLWSWKVDDKNAPAVDWHNPLTVAQNVGYSILHFPDRFRWGRILHIPR